MGYFTENFEPSELLSISEVVFLQNLASEAAYDSTKVILGLESPTSGAVNGVNLVYVFAHVPKCIFTDGNMRIVTTHYTTSGTAPTVTVTMNALIPPTEFIRSVF